MLNVLTFSYCQYHYSQVGLHGALCIFCSLGNMEFLTLVKSAAPAANTPLLGTGVPLYANRRPPCCKVPRTFYSVRWKYIHFYPFNILSHLLLAVVVFS